MDKINDIITLVLPFKAEYVSVVRLAASGVASRVGFDIDTIEDIKVAIAEVCNKLVRSGGSSAESYSVVFKICRDALTIEFDCEDKSLVCIFNDENDELGLSIISALMDQVELCSGSNYLLSISKTLEGNSLND